jgi:hypothetical protein
MALPLSVSKPKAAPVMDPPRQISSSGIAPRTDAAAPAASPATAKPSPARPSNPALLAFGGGSGFDSPVRGGGAAALGLDTGSTAQTKGASGPSAVGSVDQKHLDRLFDHGSKIYEGILKTLGATNLPQIDDPAAKFTDRSKTLATLLQNDPSLGNLITPQQFAQVQALDRMLAAVQPYVDGANKIAVDEGRGTAKTVLAFAGGEWPPPGGRYIGEGG